ncbi:conserved hypothetical protein [Ricinus communis]|uniref:Uncharacterized protein n=1 Tax=Ricinus communis TaxID=3988 RepID=B9RPY0_RICCO|nr:conserved hypothetical protein [Ricinus communis]
MRLRDLKQIRKIDYKLKVTITVCRAVKKKALKDLIGYYKEEYPRLACAKSTFDQQLKANIEALEKLWSGYS